MYEEFYGLTRRPFATSPDADGLYWSAGHAEAFATLRYGLAACAPVTVITGEIGAGKTTLLRRLLTELPEDLTVGLVSTMAEGQGALIDWILMAFGQPYGAGNPVAAFAAFRDFALRRHADGRRLLLIVDEAQTLGAGPLEELRLLTNIHSDSAGLLQLVLSGQPRLRELLTRPELAAFAQRISADYHLGPLTAGETAGYIDARMAAAGAAWPVFPRAIADLVHEMTGGVPRLVDILCDLALVYGYADDRETLDEDVLRAVFEEARQRGLYSQFAPLPKPLALVPAGARRQG